MYNYSQRPKYLAVLIAVQSFSIIGLFSLHRLPKIIRTVGNDMHSPSVRISEIAALLISTMLLLSARGILLRRKRAWILATALQCVLIFVAIGHVAFRIFMKKKDEEIAFHALGISHLATEILILILLLLAHSNFKTKADAHTRRRALAYLLKITGLSYVVAFVFIGLDHQAFVTIPNFFQINEIAIKGFFGISSNIVYASSAYQERIEYSLGALGLLIAATSTWQFFRPVPQRFLENEENEKSIRALLGKYTDNDSLSYFALRNDKNFVWSNNGKSAIPYSVKNGVMLTSGDPIGDRESWPDAMVKFVDEAEHHAWIPAVYGCSAKAGSVWTKSMKFDSLEIGDEAIIDTARFTLEGPEMKNVRQMVNRILRAGYTVSIRRIKDIDEQELEALRNLAQAWRNGANERGFSMALGRFCDPRDPEGVVALASVDSSPRGILQFVPWSTDSLSLDLMRRSPDADAGLNELLICEMVNYARENGILRLSLNFATFRSIFERGEKLGAGPITRLTYRILIFLSRFVQMESLYRFNGKFRPIWEPRYVLFPKVGHLLKVSIAILLAESFITTPKQKFSALRRVRI